MDGQKVKCLKQIMQFFSGSSNKQGERGEKGEIGHPGVSGPKGLRGPIGPLGAPGSAGPPVNSKLLPVKSEQFSLNSSLYRDHVVCQVQMESRVVEDPLGNQGKMESWETQVQLVPLVKMETLEDGDSLEGG